MHSHSESQYFIGKFQNFKQFNKDFMDLFEFLKVATQSGGVMVQTLGILRVRVVKYRAKYFYQKLKLFRRRPKNFSEIFSKKIRKSGFFYFFPSKVAIFFMTCQNFSKKPLNPKTIPPPKFPDKQKYLPLNLIKKLIL